MARPLTPEEIDSITIATVSPPTPEGESAEFRLSRINVPPPAPAPRPMASRMVLSPEEIDSIDATQGVSASERIMEETWKQLTPTQKLELDLSRMGQGAGRAVAGGIKGVAMVAERMPPILSEYSSPEQEQAFADWLERQKKRTGAQKQESLERSPIYQAGKKVEAATERSFPVVQPQSVTRPLGGLAEGLGNLAPSLAFGVLGIPAAIAAGGSMELSDAYEREIERQRQAGEPLDPDKAFAKASIYALGASAIETKLGVGRILGKIKNYFGDKLATEVGQNIAKRGWNAGMDFLKERAKDFGAGFTEEASQRLLQDLIVEGEPDLAGIWQEGMMGGGAQAVSLGLAKGAASTAKAVQEAQTRRALGRREAAKPPVIGETPQTPGQMIQAIADREGFGNIPPVIGQPLTESQIDAIDTEQKPTGVPPERTGDVQGGPPTQTVPGGGVPGTTPSQPTPTTPAPAGAGAQVPPVTPPATPPGAKPTKKPVGVTTLPATMDTARKLVDMPSADLITQAKGFNKINLDIGKNATPEEYEELKQLRDKADARYKKAAYDAALEPTEAKHNEMAILSTLPQFYNEAIKSYEEAHKPKSTGKTEPEPTDAQIEAGNFPKRQLSVHGLNISIETEKGGVRRSKPGAKVKWEVTMPVAYGYIKRTEGKDGDAVDVYVGDNPESQKVFIIDQINPDTGKFDEHKVMLGFNSLGEANAAYRQSFSDDSASKRYGYGTDMTLDEFKQWLKSGDTKKALRWGTGYPEPPKGIKVSPQQWHEMAFYNHEESMRRFGTTRARLLEELALSTPPSGPKPKPQPKTGGEKPEKEVQGKKEEGGKEVLTPKAPEPKPAPTLPPKWTSADVDFFIKQIEDGRVILWGGNNVGLPAIQDVPGAKHLGMGAFQAKGPDWKIDFDGGGAMERTDSGVSYTVAHVEGNYPYDKEGTLKILRGFKPAEKLITTEDIRKLEETVPTPEVTVRKATKDEIRLGNRLFIAVATTNEGGRLAVDESGPTEEIARQKVITTFNREWLKRDEAQKKAKTGKYAKPAPAKKPSITDSLDDADKARLEELKARLRAKLKPLPGDPTGLTAGLDPEDLLAATEMAGFYIKAGTKRFAEFAASIKNDLPDIWDRIKAHLRQIWEGAAVSNPEIEEISRGAAQTVIEKLDREGTTLPEKAKSLDERYIDAMIVRMRRRYENIPERFWQQPFRNVLSTLVPDLTDSIKETAIRQMDKGVFLETDSPQTMAIKDVAAIYDELLSLFARGNTEESQIYEVNDQFSVKFSDGKAHIIPVNEKMVPDDAPTNSWHSDYGSYLQLSLEQLESDYALNLVYALAESIREKEFSGEESKTPAPPPDVAIGNWVMDKLAKHEQFKSQELFDQADVAYGGSQAEGKYTVKDAYDALESGINRFILAHSELFQAAPGGRSDVVWGMHIVSQLKELLSLVPTQSARTAESDKMQQFSTPPTLSFAANWVANVKPNDVMLEPSAGIGGIAVFPKVSGATVVANELSDRRLEVLKNTGIADIALNENAEHLHAILTPKIANGEIPQPTVVVMNPPFSNAAKSGETKNTMIGADHVEEALKLLPPGGRLVAIVGEGMAMGKVTFVPWWRRIGQKYNIRANIGVSGDEYRKYGTSFGNQLLVIDNTGPTTDLGNVVTGQVQKVEELIPLLEGIRNDRPISQTPSAPPKPGSAPTPGARPAAPKPQPGARPPTGTGGAGGGGRPSRPSAGGIRPQPTTPAVRPPTTGTGTTTGGRVEPTPPTTAGEPAATSEEADVAGVTLEKLDAGRRELNEAGIFSEYHPTKVKIAGSKKHPTPLVESTSMAAVEVPDPTYTPKLPQSLIESGKPSEAQLEAVVYAGQAHEKMLPNGERQGFFIGDGTGSGKGVELSTIIVDNVNHGRKKHVWISKTPKLIKDAKRDLAAVGYDIQKVYDLSKTGVPDKLSQFKDGVAFIGYTGLAKNNPGLDPQSTMPGQKAKLLPARAPRPGKKAKKSRMQALYDWLGPDFDGVIALDEAHMAGNAIDLPGRRGVKRASARGRTVVELQKLFPNARIVYASATGATDVTNLSYADRLGIWGHGTPFPNKQSFFDAIRSGGLSAMEIVARDLKSMGKYLARSLSFEGVDQQSDMVHNLTPEQIGIYNEASDAWQLVFAQVDEAMARSGANMDPAARSAARSQMYGAQQRFYNTLLTAMQTPTIIREMRKDLEAGNSVLLQVVNTNEATLNRELASKASENDQDLENLDLSPKDQLLQYVNDHFPTAKYEPQQDAEGNVVWVQVLDAKGNPVQDPEAVAAKEALLDRLAGLAMPQNPLEMILDTFGAENVAEVTGRSRRVVQKKQPDGTLKRVIETKRGPAQTTLETEEFQDGKRRILIFSDAGGTGFSYHADKTKKNQQRRIHYLLQAGWRADAAIQGMGRSHRSNQASAPFYKLVSTNIKGHQRFISTVARRLAELGALTTGERKTTSGLFDETNNLENSYAEDAVFSLFSDLYNNQVEGFNFNDVSRQMGYIKTVIDPDTGDMQQKNTLINEDSGALNESKVPSIQQFLNRVLMLKFDDQNALFDEFMRRMQTLIEAAKASGDYDPGTQTLRALEIRKLKDDVVYSHPESTARTRLVEIESDQPQEIIEWEDIEKIDSRMPVEAYVVNKRSGKIYALKAGRMQTLDSGEIVPTWRRISPTGFDIDQRRNVRVVDSISTGDRANYDLISDPAEARKEWREQVRNAPKIATKRDTYVAGAMLPIWDRLQLRSPKIWRIKTDEGENILGAHVPAKDVPGLRRRLGAGAASQMTGEQAFDLVLDNGDTIPLSNGWTLKRVYRSGENRIEVTGVTPDQQREFLQFIGGFMERIDFRSRFFIPTDRAAGIEALNKVLTKAPPTAPEDQGGQAQASVTSVAPMEGQTRPVGVATSLEDFRQLIADPELGLPQEAQAIINAFLDSPVGKLLPHIYGVLHDSLAGGFQGSYFQRVISLARNASPETGAHELSHALWELLPDDIKAEFERLRVESINDVIGSTEDERVKAALEQLRDNPIKGGTDWVERDFPREIWDDIYKYSSSEEFFAYANSKHYQAKVGSVVPGFWDQVKQIWRGFMEGVRRMLRVSKSLDDRVGNWLSRIERGEFQPRPEQAVDAEREAQASIEPEPRDEDVAADVRASAGLSMSDLELQEEIGRAEAEASPEDRAVYTQVFGRRDRVAGREGLTPETIAAGQAYTKAVMDSLNIPVVQDESGRWKLADETAPDETAGIQLVQRLREELANQETDAPSKGFLGNLLDSIVVNFTPDRIQAFSEDVRGELYSLAQGERSHRGLMLGALAHMAKSVEYVARNAGVILRRVYSDAFGGEEIGYTLDHVRELIRKQFTMDEIMAVVRSNKRLADYIATILPGERGRLPTIDQIIQAVLAMPFRSQQHLAELFAEQLVDRLGISQPEAEHAAELFSEAFDQKFKAARTAAFRQARANLAPRTPSERKGKSLWRKIEEAVNAGVFDTGDVLKRMAREYGWKIPSDRDLDNLRRWVDEMQRLRELTPAEAARGMTQADKEGATIEKRIVLKKQIETLWNRLTHPLNYRTMQGASNIAAAINEFTSANLLLRLSFGPRQLIDVLTQGGIHNPTRAIAAAIGRWQTDKFSGRDANLWREISDALSESYRQRFAATRAALTATRSAFAGTGEARNVDRLMSRIAVFERAMQAADEASASGEHAKAAMLKVFSMLRLGYRIAQALDNLHGLPTEYQEMRQQVTTFLRTNGQSRAEAFMNADQVMGDMRAEWQLAIARAQELSDLNGWRWNPKQITAAAWNMVKARQYQRMREMDLPADEFEEQNRILRNVVGWNEREEGGIGGVFANLIGRASGYAQSIGLPLPLARFGNAIGIGINRALSFTPMGFFPQAFKGSPWYRTPEDQRQRKVEAAVGSAVGVPMFLLAATGAIIVRLKWPRDKEERELWEREGHRPGTVEIPVGDGKFIALSTTTGPLALVRPWLAAGGGIHDVMTQRAKAQDKLEAEALAKGVPAGKIRPVGIGDLMAVAASTAWGSITGGRTASGLVGSVTDFGSFNPRKFASSLVSPVLPGVPAYQEVARMAGWRPDFKTASVADFLIPLPTSKNRQVNMLGDPVGQEDGLQRVLQILTGGSSPLAVDPADARQTTAYQTLYETGYRPPSINPGQAYLINGEFRPFNDLELEQYTLARGQAFKSELEALGPNPDKKAVQAAYQRANEAALAKIGASRPPRGGRYGVTTPSRTTAGSQLMGLGLPQTIRGGGVMGQRISSPARYRGVQLRGRRIRGRSLGRRRALGRRSRLSRGPSLRMRRRSLGRIRY